MTLLPLPIVGTLRDSLLLFVAVPGALGWVAVVAVVVGVVVIIAVVAVATVGCIVAVVVVAVVLVVVVGMTWGHGWSGAEGNGRPALAVARRYARPSSNPVCSTLGGERQ